MANCYTIALHCGCVPLKDIPFRYKRKSGVERESERENPSNNVHYPEDLCVCEEREGGRRMVYIE